MTRSTYLPTAQIEPFLDEGDEELGVGRKGYFDEKLSKIIGAEMDASGGDRVSFAFWLVRRIHMRDV